MKENNTLWFGDNLDVLRNFPDECVDLIYLDPPFNSNASYNMLFKEKTGKHSEAQHKAFEDTWSWDGNEAELAFDELIETCRSSDLVDKMMAMRKFLGENNLMAYLTMMAIRLIEMRRVLKSTGSIYLHCDPTASHYLKLVMDAVFGANNFRNEIIWCYASPSGARKVFPRKHDTIFFYTKREEYNFEIQRIPHKSGLHNTGQSWDFVDGDPKYVKELEKKGKKVEDWWTDIYPVDRIRKERLGYPTQKPEALLERIIKASSNEGDVVLDPFCGCGTAVVAAEKLNRKWIGIDITYLAVKLIRKRLKDTFGKDLSEYNIEGIPQDLRSAENLATYSKKGRFQFEWWALDAVDADYAGDKKMGSDKGIDGIKMFKDEPRKPHKKIVFQVKSGKVQFSYVQQLKGAMKDEEAEIGVLITLQKPTKPMIKEASKEGFYISPLYPDRRFPRLQILTIEEILDGKRPEYPVAVSFDLYKNAVRQQKEDGSDRGLL